MGTASGRVVRALLAVRWRLSQLSRGRPDGRPCRGGVRSRAIRQAPRDQADLGFRQPLPPQREHRAGLTGAPAGELIKERASTGRAPDYHRFVLYQPGHGKFQVEDPAALLAELCQTVPATLVTHT